MGIIIHMSNEMRRLSVRRSGLSRHASDSRLIRANNDGADESEICIQFSIVNIRLYTLSCHVLTQF